MNGQSVVMGQKTLDLLGEELNLPVKPKVRSKKMSLSAKPAKSNNGFVSSIWEFPTDEDVNYASHGLYRWYGTLPAPMIDKLLDLYTTKNSKILDIFLGSGTSLVESVLKKRLNCTGMDVNPLSCLISTVKLTPLRITGETESELGKLGIAQEGEKQFINDFLKNPTYAYTIKWFRDDVLQETLAIIYRVSYIKDAHLRNLCLVSLANIIKLVANIDPRCTHHLVTKKKPYTSTYGLLRKEIAKNLSILGTLNTDLKWCAPKVVQGSASAISKYSKEKVDFIIAHPPYLGSINYANIHRPPTDLLCHYSKKFPTQFPWKFNFDEIKTGDLSTDSEKDYLKGVQIIIDEVDGALKKNGRIALIMGDGRHKGMIRHPFTHMVAMLKEKDLMMEEMFIWILNNNSGMHIKRRGHHIDHNYIMIFKKQ